MKKAAAALCSLAFALVIHGPAQADYYGQLTRGEVLRVEIASASPDKVALTVYYLGRSVDLVDVTSVPTPGGTAQFEYSGPGRNVRRVILQVDPPPADTATVRVNSGGAITLEESKQLLFDVVD